MNTRSIHLLIYWALVAFAFTRLFEVRCYATVGYINRICPPGFSMHAFPLLSADGNSVTDVGFGDTNFLRSGITVFTMGTNGFVANNFLEGWADPAMPLPLGHGWFVKNPYLTNLTATLVGEVVQGSNSFPVPQGFSMPSSIHYAGGGLSSTLHFPASDGDVAYIYDNASGNYSNYVFSSSWSPSEPTLEIGQSFWVDKTTSSNWSTYFFVDTQPLTNGLQGYTNLSGPEVITSLVGQLNFFTYNATNSGLGRVYANDGITPLSGNYLAQLYAGTNSFPDLLQPIGTPVGFMSGSAAGYVRSGTVFVPFATGGQTVWVQLRVWNQALGSSYEEAVTNGSLVGRSFAIPLAARATIENGQPGIPPPDVNTFPSLIIGLPATPPGILVEPLAQGVSLGGNATFSVVASEVTPLIYTWRRNGTNIASGTSGSLTLTNVQAGDSGKYSVQIASAWGTATSAEAVLTVNPTFCAVPDFGLVGYASMSGGTVGGQGGATVTVNNAADFITQVATPGSRVVQVQGVIDLGMGIVTVTSDKTIVGLGSDATLVGNLRMPGASNIIFRNLRFTNPAEAGEGDGLTLKDGVSRVWIDHCTFHDFTDGALDITRGSDLVTVSWCRFYYTSNSTHRLVNLIGGDDAHFDTDRGALNVTLHHNWWSTLTDQRMPRVRYGDVHVFNNYYDGVGNLYCVGAGVESELLIENNYFQSIRDPYRLIVTSGTNGLIRATNNLFADCTFTSSPSDTNAIFTPPYAYQVDSVGDVPCLVTTFAGAGKLAPVIYSPPLSQTATQGMTATLSVLAVGGEPLAYQWYFNTNTLLANATNASLTMTNLLMSSAGTYHVVVTNLFGAATSASAVLSVMPLPPQIVVSPQSQTNVMGSSVNFSVVATGTAPLSYQWRFNGISISGAAATNYTIASVQATNAGGYDVVVANGAGSVTSAVAVLTVPLPPADLIAQWNFNSIPPDGNEFTGTSNPSYEVGSAATVGGVSTTFGPGDPVTDPAGASDNSAWRLSNFPAATQQNKTAGARFDVSTTGRQNIRISWQQRAAANASKYVRLQYSTNSGASFFDVPGAILMSSDSTFQHRSNNLSGILGLNNQATLAFRIVTEFESTATGSGMARYVPVSGGSYSPGSQISFDMVTVYGEAINLEPFHLGGATYTTAGAFQIGLTGQLGTTYVIQATTNLSPATWISLHTNVSPFTFFDSNAVNYPQRFYRAVSPP